MEFLNEKKIRRRYRLVFCFILITFVLLLINNFHKKVCESGKVLRIGVFTGSYWNRHNGNSYKILNDAIAEYEKKYPEVSVEYVSGITRDNYEEWLSEKMVLGDMPDVFFVPSGDFNVFLNIGAMKNLNGFIKKDTDFSESIFYEKTLLCGKNKNGQYAIPYECSPTMMMVNETLLDQNGIILEGKDWTWSEFYNICEKVCARTSTSIDQYGVINYGWKDAFTANKVKLFSKNAERCDFTGNNIYESIIFLERLAKLPQGRLTSATDFYKGIVAFEPMMFSTYRSYKARDFGTNNYTDFEWRYTTMPAGTSGDNISRLDTLCVAMSDDTPNPEEAWNFIKILTCSDKIQKEIFDYSEGLSPLRKVTENDELSKHMREEYGIILDKNIISEVMDNAEVQVKFLNQEDVEAEVGNAVNSILEANSNIQMEQIIWNRRINDYLKKLK